MEHTDLGTIQVYYGVKHRDGTEEWYITQDMVHWACIIREGRNRYTIDHDKTGIVYISLREAAETYGEITNNLFVQHLDRLWSNYIYMPFWDAYWWIHDLFRKEKNGDDG